MQFRVRPSSGPQAGQDAVISGAAYCAEIKRADDRLRQLTGTDTLPVWRAPGGKTSAAMLKNASNVAMPTWVGHLLVFWAMNCPATATPIASCCQKRCATFAQETS
jgi:hypothetical protein